MYQASGNQKNTEGLNSHTKTIKKTKDINKFNCFFVDIDCGRVRKNEYYPLEDVEKFKAAKMTQIKNFDIQAWLKPIINN